MRTMLTMVGTMLGLLIGGWLVSFGPFGTNPQELALTPTERAVLEKVRETGRDVDDLSTLLVQLYAESRAGEMTVGATGPLELTLWNDWGGLDVESGDTIEGVMFADGDWTGLHHSPYAGPLDDATIRNVALLHMEKWASRMYRVRSGVLVEDVTVAGVLCEHGFYFNMAGYNDEVDLEKPALVFRRCHWRDVGSQAVQLVYRPEEQDFDFEAEGDGTPGGLILVEYCLLENVGWNRGGSARASYALSFFATDNPVLLRRTVLDNSAQAESKGALLVEERWRADVEDCRFTLGVTDRPVAIFRDVEVLRVTGCHFEAAGGQAWIDVERCPDVEFSGCTGNVLIRRDGDSVAMIDEGASW